MPPPGWCRPRRRAGRRPRAGRPWPPSGVIGASTSALSLKATTATWSVGRSWSISVCRACLTRSSRPGSAIEPETSTTKVRLAGRRASAEVGARLAGRPAGRPRRGCRSRAPSTCTAKPSPARLGVVLPEGVDELLRPDLVRLGPAALLEGTAGVGVGGGVHVEGEGGDLRPGGVLVFVRGLTRRGGGPGPLLVAGYLVGSAFGSGGVATWSAAARGERQQRRDPDTRH